MRHPWRECDIPDFFAELRSANARYARNSARLRLAGCSFPHVPKNVCLLSGYLLYCEHTHSWYGFQARHDQLWAIKEGTGTGQPLC
jgi:hypothetical protein